MQVNEALRTYNKSVDIGSMPDRIRRLPISAEGWPVPWFVTWFRNGRPCADGDGEPDFRIVDPAKLMKAYQNKICWVCGNAPIGVYKCFVIGPMCAINRVISEPPQHRDCAIWSAKNCPFLSKPKMARNERELPDGHQQPAGIGIRRNPGAVCVWITKSFNLFRANAGNAGVLFSLGTPVEVLWFANGRTATRAEVMASIDSGYPLLENMARQDGKAALAALATQREVAMALVPER